MARFYQTPDLVPADYGFDLPYREIMGVLQQKQAEQDANLTTLKGYQDDKGPNARQPDFDIRRNFMAKREERLDNLMFDENGRLRDLTKMNNEILQEARIRSKEEKAGGTFWALETSYQNELDYIKSIKENKDIGDDRKNRLIDFSTRRNVQGIGVKDEYGLDDLYSGIIAAKEVDEHKIISDVLKDWKPSQIQISTGFDGQVAIDPTSEALQELMNKNPEYKKILGGEFYQTGTLEYVLVDDLYNESIKMMTNNTEIMDDISQQAMLLGLNPEQQQEYIAAKIDETAMAIAKEYSRSKFTPKTLDNWKYKKQLDLSNGKALIDYENAQKMRVMYQTTATSQRSMKTSTINDMRKAAQELIKTSSEKLKQYESQDGIPSEETRSNPVLMAEYKELKHKLSQARSQVHNTNQMLINFMDPSIYDAKKIVMDKATDLFNNIKSGIGGLGFTPDKQGLVSQVNSIYEQEIIKYLENYDQEALKNHLIKNNGQLPEDIRIHLKQVENKLVSTLSQDDIQIPYKINNLSAELSNEITASANVTLDNYLNSSPNKEIPFTSNVKAMSSYSGAGSGFSGELGAVNKAITGMVKRGEGVWLDAVTQDPTSPAQRMKELGGDLTKMEIVSTLERDPSTGAPIYLVTSVKGGKNGNQEPVSFSISPDESDPTYANNIKVLETEFAMNLAESARGQSSNSSKKEQHTMATQLLGHKFAPEIAQSGIEFADAPKDLKSAPKAYFNNNNMVVVKTPENHYAVYLTKEVDGKLMVDTEGLITDFREYSSTPNTPVFKSLNEVYQLLGEGIAEEEFNFDRK